MLRLTTILLSCIATIAYAATIENPQPSVRYIPYTDKNGNVQYEDLYSTKPKIATMSVKPSQISFHLHTQNSPNEPELIIGGNDFKILSKHAFDTNLPVVLTIHGWKGKLTEEVNTDIRASTLQQGNANVFAVDWTEPADKFYTTAKDYVDDVGVIVGEFVVYLRELGVPHQNIKIIGFSLGAHIAGFAGKTIKNLSNLPTPLIVGLDPAGPFFNGLAPSKRLDKTDAEFVQVIHCNTATLGIESSIGAVDYFPNSGSKQAGCGLDFGGSCSHMRCPVLYGECMRKPEGCLSLKANSYNDFKSGKTSGNATPLGVFVDSTISGNYYLDTNAKPPYSLE